MDSNDAMGGQDHVEPPPNAQEQVSADLESSHGTVGLPQNVSITNDPQAPAIALNYHQYLVQQQRLISFPFQQTGTLDNHLQLGNGEGEHSKTVQKQGTTDGMVQSEPFLMERAMSGKVQDELVKHQESKGDATREGTHDQDTTFRPAAQAQPREVPAELTFNDPSSSAVHDHTAPTTTSDENKHPSNDGELLPAEASGTHRSAANTESVRGNSYMLSGSVTATDQDSQAAKVNLARVKSIEDHEHLLDAEPEAAVESGKDDGTTLGGEDDSVNETTAEPEGDQSDEEEENDEEYEVQDGGEQGQGDDDDVDDEDDRFQLMQVQLEQKVAQTRAKLAAAGYQHSRSTAVNPRFTQHAHETNVQSGIYSGLRQTQQQPRHGYQQVAYSAPSVPGYGNNIPGGQQSRSLLSSYAVPGYETRPMFNDYPYDPMNMRPLSQMRPPQPYQGRAPAYQNHDPHDRFDMFFGHPAPRQELYGRDPYPQNYHPGEDPMMYGTSDYHQARPRVPATANRMPSQAQAYMSPPRAQRPAPRHVVEEEDGTDDDEPLKSRVQRHPSAIVEPVKGATSAGKKGQSDKDEDVQFVSSQPKMGFKPPKTKKAAAKKTSEPPPAQPTPTADPAPPTEPIEPAQAEPDDTSIKSIDWTLPKYDATFEPPTTKDDPTVAKISLPGLYREELLLSPDHPEQETHLLLNIFMPAQQTLAVPDPEPAIAILNFHTLAVMCIEAYVQFEIGDELGTGRGHWHDEYDRSAKEYRRLRDAKDADPDEIFFAVIDRWRAGVESNKKGAKMIRGVQEFCDTVLDIVYYIKENGLWKKEVEKKSKKKGGDGGGDGEEGGKRGTKRQGGKVNEPKVTKKAKTEKKTPAKKVKKKSEPGLTVITRK